MGGTLYAPNFATHDSTASSGIGTYTAFSPVSQTAVTGAGSGSNPFKIVTVVNVVSLQPVVVIGPRHHSRVPNSVRA